jgi:ribonuclease Y
MAPLILSAIAALIVGGVAGFMIRRQMAAKSEVDLEAKSKEMILAAKDEALKLKEQAKKEEEEQRRRLDDIEKNLRQREESLDRRAESLDKDRTGLEAKQKDVETLKTELGEARTKHQSELEKVAKLSKEEAKEQLLSQIERDYKDDLVKKIKDSKEALQEESEKMARKILSTVIQRLASEHTSESVTSSVHIPNEEMKGRIIGKEGRNIQHFEKVTGVDLMIDETPDAVTLSCFDPIRRHVGKVTLERLVAEGKINAATIEETFKKVTEEVGKEVKEAGEAAAYEAGVPGLHIDVLKILGRLKFRTSYGQNVLAHSVEMTHIAAMLASELGADVNVVKKAALMHDIGKALDHDVPGAHHHISMDIARKYGMSEIVINAIGAHHDDIEPKSVEAIIVKAADAISGARPGARRDSFESYVKRLTELENVANGFDGVEKSYAIQAGREVRIIVKPEAIDDYQALKLARDIAKKIESDLQYPGMIKVNVIREVRAVEYAK